jgi:tyrocidine synthetase-3
LESALTELCDRHEALRTAFVERDGELFQRIHPVVDFALTLGEAIDEQDIDDLIKPLLQPFDLSLPGLLRCAVAPLGPERHALALNLHHLVADGVSAGLLVEELLALATGEIRDASPTPYREYVAWEQAYLASPEAERDEAAWRERLAALPPRVELPQDMTAAGPRAFGCRRIGRDLTHPERLRSFARARGVTMNMLLQAIFQVWLASVSRREEVFYGSPSAGRPAGRFDATIGLFIGVLVYRARVGAGTRFADLLDAVRTDTAALLKLQHLPFERLQRLLPDPGDGGTPFEVGINYDGQLGPFQCGPLRVTPGALDGRPGMSLACVLDLRDIGERLRLDIAHDPARYSRDAVAGWAALFDALAQVLTEAPERPIGELIAGLAGDGAALPIADAAA